MSAKLIFILVFINVVNIITCLNVKMREYHDVEIDTTETKVSKRQLAHFFDKASYNFNGFQKIESVPVLFPIDICVFSLVGVKYAAALHMNKAGVRHFAVFQGVNNSYTEIVDLETPIAIAMDCLALDTHAYVALAYNITQPIERAQFGSPIFEISADRVRAVQFFGALNLASVYLRFAGDDFYLLQTFQNMRNSQNLNCPYFRWTGSTFNKIGRIPCSNARHLEPFSIDDASYVAVANYADQHGNTETDSEIYKFIPEERKFMLFQSIPTNGAVDVRYFSVPVDETRRQHFLVFGNSRGKYATGQRRQGDKKNLEADSIFYMFDKGQFVPYQHLTFYAVQQFLPIQNMDAEKFIILVACTNQDIKIYNFNDWKFEESEAQFTEGALGKGVVNMRVYQENDMSYLVIANNLMAENETNIFMPIFKQDEEANQLRHEMIEWTKENLERLQKIDVEKLKEDLERKIENQSQITIPVEVRSIPKSNINKVTTKSFIYPRLRLNRNYWKALKYANQAFDALEAQFTLASPASPATSKQKTQQAHTNAEAHTQAASQTEPDTAVHATKQKREIPNGANQQKLQQQLMNTMEFEHLKVHELRVHENLSAKRVNGVNTKDPHFRSIKAKQILVTDNYEVSSPVEEATAKARLSTETENGTQEELGVKSDVIDVLNVQDLRLGGKFNEFSWSDLRNNTLKRVAEQQFIKASAYIGALRTNAFVVTNNEISGENIRKLISIKDGDYVVNQDVQFAAPVIAKNVMINERLNNINVQQQKRLNVLLKKSNETQLIKGVKKFENIRVKAPIEVAGQMIGPHFTEISPSRTLHEDMILNGDFIITGDVSISKHFSTHDVIDVHSNISLKTVLQNAIRLNSPLQDVNLKFEQPLVVNDSIVSFVNALDLQHLVKTNVDRIQVIEGAKMFKNDLEIRNGSSEVENLNGINVKQLEERLLLKNTNQTINAPMHFGKVVARGINATSLALNQNDISNYLTQSTSQHINSTLKVDKLYANQLNTNNLNMNGKIFGAPLAEIYQQKAKNAPHPEIFREGQKFHGSIYVKNLKTNSSLNGVSMQTIERQLAQLEGDIKYFGDLKFNYEMNIHNLTFNGKLNGIPAADFGQCWLQKVGAQEFSAPQTFAEVVTSEASVKLNGRLNGQNVDDFVSKTYWINRDEYMPRAIMQNPTDMQGALLTSTLNGIRAPADMLYRSANSPQILSSNVSIAGNLTVNGDIVNVTTMNSIELQKLERFSNGFDTDTLYVENATFNYSPQFNTLNRYDLESTLNTVWLKNEDVELQQSVKISNGNFVGLLELEGPINNVNLQHLQENYFSLSRPQQIETQLVFEHEVNFKNELNINEMHLQGPIFDSKSNTTFNFNEFATNTLKTAGVHHIGGVWRIREAYIPGNLENAQINGLNLANDIVRPLEQPQILDITGSKQVKAAVIDKLYATSTSTINGVPIANWLRNTVFMDGNYSIQGTTTLDAVNIFNDLRVAGNVNGLPFNEHTLLLRDRDQVIKGDVRIHSQTSNEGQVLPVNFENLQTEMINGINFTYFLANQAKLTHNPQINSHLIFQQPLDVKEYHDDQSDNAYSAIKWRRAAGEKHSIAKSDENTSTSARNDLEELEVATQTLKASLRTPFYILKKFEYRQTLQGLSTTQLISLTLHFNNEVVDVIGFKILTENAPWRFYRWNARNGKFELDQSLSLQPQDIHKLELLKLFAQKHGNYIRIENASSSHSQPASKQLRIITDHLDGMELLKIKPQQGENDFEMVGFKMESENCFIFQYNTETVPIYCIRIVPGKQNMKIYERETLPTKGVRQISALSNANLAVLKPNGIEIWQTSPKLKLKTLLNKQQAIRMSVAQHNEVYFVAAITQRKSHESSSAQGIIDIYSSFDLLHFKLIQKLEYSTLPYQIELSVIGASNDLLLQVLSTAPAPLLVYQYKGVTGFERLPIDYSGESVERMQFLELKAAKRYFIALWTSNGLEFVEIVLNKF